MMLDLLVTNARILTVDTEHPHASSIGIWNGRVVGLDEELSGVRSRVTVDAGGATLAPGFHDAHCHTTSFGLGLVHLELDKVVGIGPTLEAVAAYADGLGTDEWVIGFGFGSGLPHDQYPDRDELDRAAGGRPVWLTHLSGHSCVVSSAASRRWASPAPTTERGAGGWSWTTTDGRRDSSKNRPWI